MGFFDNLQAAADSAERIRNVEMLFIQLVEHTVKIEQHLNLLSQKLVPVVDAFNAEMNSQPNPGDMLLLSEAQNG